MPEVLLEFDDSEEVTAALKDLDLTLKQRGGSSMQLVLDPGKDWSVKWQFTFPLKNIKVIKKKYAI